MANQFFPMLPKVNDAAKVLRDEAGVWKSTDINFLRSLADGLDCGDSIRDMGTVDSIPDMWARPLLFRLALFDREPTKQFVTGLHEKVRGEWRALLAMIALKNFKHLDLKAVQVNLREDKSELAEILKSLAPTESLSGDKSAWLTDVYVVTLDGRPLATTSPTTLIAVAADYERTFAGKLSAPWSTNQRTLSDPIKFLSPVELNALKVWLANLYGKVQRLEKIGARAKELSNALLKTLADYERDVAQAQIPSSATFDFVPSNLNLHVGISRLLDETIKGRVARLQDSAVRLLTAKKNLLLVSPESVRDFARLEGVNAAQLVVWQGISANDITDEKLFDPNKIGRVNLNGVQFRRPEDFFCERMAVTEPADAFPNALKIRGAENLLATDLTPIPPVKRELLELFTAEEISARLSITDDEENFYVHFDFPLSGVDNRGTDFRRTKTYPKRELIYIDREVPVAELWPNFRRPGWTDYFLYYENFQAQSDDDKLAEDIFYVAPFGHEKILANRFTQKLDAFPDALICTYNPPPHVARQPFEVGAILLDKPKLVEADVSLTRKISVDFGTSSTMIFFADNDAEPQPLKIEPKLYKVTESGGARAQTFRHFIPSQIPERADGSFLSVFHLLNTSADKKIRPLVDGHVFLLSSQNTRVFEKFAAHIDANLKWADDDFQRRKTAAYIAQICLQAAAQAQADGASQVEWNFSYPTAFSHAQKTSFMEICREVVGNATFWAESKAAAYHFNKLDGKAGNFAQGAICVDIGAGTTDISVVSGQSPRIVYHTSIRYAARQMFKPIYDNFELFAGEKISGKFTDESQRLAVIDADLREHSEKYLADLKFITGREQVKNVLQAAQFATAGLFHYLGELVKVLHDYGHYRESKVPQIFVGGNGARIFRWLTGGTELDGNIYLDVLEKIFVAASGLEGHKKFRLHMSDQPKVEVAAGMLVARPANDAEFFDADRINRDMFGDADEFIYAAQLAGADFSQGGQSQAATSFVSAHDLADGLTVNGLDEFKTFVARFNASNKLWAQGVTFDEELAEELLRDANNFFTDKRGRDVKKILVEPVFVAELKLWLSALTSGTVTRKLSVAETSSQETKSVAESFVADFNALSKLSGFSSRQARAKFLSRHKVRGFTCANVTERMNNPALEPKFTETSAAANGDFWASAVDGNTFAVVPNLKTYTENHHAERAFGLIFESNFDGETYSRVRVDSAAIFELVGDDWRLQRRGKIFLSK